MKQRSTCLMVLAWLTLPLAAGADVVWPALFLEARLVTWWAIATGLVVEYIFVRQLFGFGVRRAILADVCMNLASTTLGILLIPIAGIAWELFPGIILYEFFNIGTFNPGTWAMTFLLAVIVNTGIESLVIRRVFQTKVGRRGFWWLALANAVSVGAASVSLFVVWPTI